MRQTFALTLVVLALTGCSRVTSVSWSDGAPQGFDLTWVVNERKNPSESGYLCRDGTLNRDNNGVCSVIRSTPVRGLVPLGGTAEGFIDDDLTIYGTVSNNGQQTVFVATPGWFGRSQYTYLGGYTEVQGGAKASNDRYVLRVKKSGENDWGFVTLTLHR